MSSVEKTPAELTTDGRPTDLQNGRQVSSDIYNVAFHETLTPMVIASVGETDNPIVSANKAFLDLTGYGEEEVIGRDCRFLQGPGTSKEAIASIGASLRAGFNVDIAILNYRKDGSEFWNELHITPVRDDDGEVSCYFASQIDLTQTRRIADLEASEKRLLMEVDHRSKNVMAVVNSIVRLSKADDPGVYASSVQKRVQALADVHILLARKGWHAVPLQEIVEQQFMRFENASIRVSGPEVKVDAADAQPIALIVHELAGNAEAHGALANDHGSIDVSWKPMQTGGFEMTWLERGGRVPEELIKKGFGTKLVDALVERQMRGSVERDWRDDGLSLAIRIPARVDGHAGSERNQIV